MRQVVVYSTIHARKAVLQGLTPKENREIPPLKYEYVKQIQETLPDATFILNGGIKTREQACNLLEDFSGLMIGRAVYNDPFLLAELEQDLCGTPLPDRDHVIDQYREYIAGQMAEGVQLKHMTKHLFGAYLGKPGTRAFRRHLSTYMNSTDADLSVLDEALTHVR